jgi:capsular polysaccharide transport system permease protein
MSDRTTKGRNYLGLVSLMMSWSLAAGYWFLAASERYVSEAKFVVQRSGGEVSGGVSVASLLGGAGAVASQDALMLKEYIKSVDIYELLDQKLGLRAHFSDASRDLLSRLRQDAPREEFYRYMDDHITVEFDDVSAVISVSAEAYSPRMAREIVEYVVSMSESFINNVGYRLATEQVDFAALQLTETRRQLEDAKEAVLVFQNKNGVLSPEQKSLSVTTIISTLESELAAARTKLNSLTSYLSDSAQEVVAARAKVRALKAQIRRENSKLVGGVQGSKEGNKLNVLNAEFEKLKLEAEFRADTYGSALTVLEAAKIEASHKLKHLVVIESPALPEEPTYPRKLYNMVTFFAMTLLFYWIVKLGVATVRDHRD